ncbi:MAG: NrdH-redoxin [Candidatus Harrisonbacteria bacterium CG10_big_fil_rev_8_21_14_0_10_49_15]|uniref:NrdH-redoxin n=1 Tax=Candidatus Harrisonbacteria bacterium CG10_big_fil_rev_8_21_14_0_10_49_15 TaxID=1974587 RepID=A0A2H0ULZ8_9BACT|nr:MAG: NrdH-redoxin [Candidatus Harrisonbacteria bacterium CG10_big_fil_rev_8_21_14_0_10_49_15]
MSNVTIYSTPTCAYCKMAKEYFTEKGVEFKEINVAEDMEAQQAMIQKSGQMGVPVIEIGDKVIVGFNKNEVEEALGSA